LGMLPQKFFRRCPRVIPYPIGISPWNIIQIFQRITPNYLLTMKEFLPDNFIAELPASIIIEEGEYEFYCFNLKDN
ncbi:MAG: hypothetical protein KKC23_02160, partial [Proteobacteria bacterium]|nr:hypothetical protein [Pseudomonadota bacterium]